MSESDYVRILRSGAEPTNDPVTLRPVVADDLDDQVREMEQARAEAAVSGAAYLIFGDQP